MINIFYPKNSHSLIVSLGFLSGNQNLIFIKKTFFPDISKLTKFIEKNLKVKFLYINSLNDIQKIILEIEKKKSKNEINFFHKENNDKFSELVKQNINFIFLEHGIGNYYNFINRNYILILKDYLRSVGIKKYKFYAGIYSLLTNNIFINGSKVGRLFPKKIYEILGIILKFYQKYSSLNIFFKKLSDTKKVVLVNVPKYLSNDDFKIFIYRLLSLNRVINKFYFKFKSNDENKKKRCKYIKKTLKTQNKIPIILNDKFKKIPFELLIYCTKNIIIFTSISNVPFVSSLLFKNIIYLYLPKSIKKKYYKFPEVKKNTHIFYKKNFSKIKFI